MANILLVMIIVIALTERGLRNAYFAEQVAAVAGRGG